MPSAMATATALSGSELVAVAPTAMVFVRGQYDGSSHSPREYSTPQDRAAGVAVLAGAVLELANR
jgi:N-carbamoyl-L-amino-acid hydrolase